MNTFGHVFKITTFGESHGEALGVVIDGCPPYLQLSAVDIQNDLDRRAPGQSSVTTSRKEKDTCEILSGVFEGRTTGTSLAVIVRNENQNSKDYSTIKDVFRPSHADYSFQAKYGVRDYRGGGRSSGRETIARVIGGAVAKKVLERFQVEVFGFARAIGGEVFSLVEREFIEENPLRMADRAAFPRTMKVVEEVQRSGDSLGGEVELRVKHLMAGIGSPVFDKLEALLARACLSVGAVKGFVMGDGERISQQKGSEANDPFLLDENERLCTERNANGGVLGGISTGEDIWFRVFVKPTASIRKTQKTVNMKKESVEVSIQGRHDPLILPRVIPVLEAMTALVLVDQLMVHKAQCEW